jgi:hypothetical protein
MANSASTQRQHRNTYEQLSVAIKRHITLSDALTDLQDLEIAQTFTLLLRRQLAATYEAARRLRKPLRTKRYAIPTNKADDRSVPWDPDEYMPLFKGLDLLERKCRYALAGKPMFPIPEAPYKADTVGHYRVQTVARLIWILEREDEEEPMFPAGLGRDRYCIGEWPTNSYQQRGLLPLESSWMARGNVDIPLSAEWDSLFFAVGGLSFIERKTMRFLRNLGIERGLMKPDGMKRVTEFTQPVAGDGDCPVCGDAYADDGVEGHEPAVKLVCGHVIGRDCLQQWTDTFILAHDSNGVTCPNCRAALVIGQLPLADQPLVWDLINWFRSDRTLDEEIDLFLVNAEEEDLASPCQPSFGIMITKLHERFCKAVELLEKLGITKHELDGA